jgi:hypothetical protein
MEPISDAPTIDAVITSYNQKNLILETVESVFNQTVKPSNIYIIDDGSSDFESLEVLHALEQEQAIVPIHVIYQENLGVSAARNNGIRHTNAPFVLVLDGDDKLMPTFLESTTLLLNEHPHLVAASSWLKTFGVLDAIIKPAGGRLQSFLSHNCCPATHLLRRKAYEQCLGYDETMKSGYEDWKFFLRLLETSSDAAIGIVNQPLIAYRTNPTSSNVKSMTNRLSLMEEIINKHLTSYQNNIVKVLLDIESTSDERLANWEDEIKHSCATKNEISTISQKFMACPSYGDGGMAAAVRIASNLKSN